MKWIKASKFKAGCEVVISDSVEDATVVVKNGKPKGKIARRKGPWRSHFGADKGKIRILGDIVSPDLEAWESTARKRLRRA